MRFITTAIIAIFAILFILPGCGDDDRRRSSSSRDDGVTPCGDSTCQPGNYCTFEATGTCATGCTSDANCQSTHQCENIDSFSGTGICERKVSSPTNNTSTNNTSTSGAVQGCLDFCDRAQQCEFLNPAETSGCKTICRDEATTDQERQLLADCSTAASTCQEFRSCGFDDGGGNNFNNSNNTNNTSQQGFTSCGHFTTCQPGQYCEDSDFGDCELGCLSNVNCAADQTCQKPAGEQVGVCEND